VPSAVYYLAPNVVNYRQGENLRKYYTLDTVLQIYEIFTKNRVIGMVYYIHDGNGHYQNKSVMPGLSFIGRRDRDYLSIRKHGHDVIVFTDNIRINSDPKQFNAYILGYIGHDKRIIFVASGGSMAQEAQPDGTVKHFHYQQYNLLSAESYFLMDGASGLTQAVNNFYKRMKNVKK
jgi:hypothetical protein